MEKRMMQVLAWMVCTLLLTGCAITTTESVKVRDLEYTLLSAEVIPGQLMTLIEEKGGEAFRFTYRDKDYLYICIGYGMQNSGGHQIVVDELYLTEEAIYVGTTLLGPESKDAGEPHNPVIVIKTEKLDEQVIYK